MANLQTLAYKTNILPQIQQLLLPPNHLIDYAGVALDEFDDLGADVFVGVGRDRNAVVSVLYHFYSHVDCLKEVVLVDAGEDEAAFIDGFRSLGGCTDADCRE